MTLKLTIEIGGVTYGGILDSDSRADGETIAEQAGEVVKQTILGHYNPTRTLREVSA